MTKLDQATVEALPPCPFCGSCSLHYRNPFSDDDGDDSETWVVACNKCNAEGPYYGGTDSTQLHEAMNLWSTRALTAMQASRDDEVERLRGELRKIADYGKIHTGMGWTCHNMALRALDHRTQGEG